MDQVAEFALLPIGKGYLSSRIGYFDNKFLEENDEVFYLRVSVFIPPLVAYQDGNRV